MKPRSLGRRLALQYLFMAEIAGFENAGGIDEFLRVQKEAEEDAGQRFDGREGEKWNEAAAFARRLANEALRERPALDAAIAEAADHWDFARIAPTDKSALRVAAAELRLGEVELPVLANEAVRLAKTFGGPESGAFVNGVLMGLFRRSGRGGEWRGAPADAADAAGED